MTIKLSQFISSVCAVSLSDAEKIIKKNPAKEAVILDFQDIKAVSSPFLRKLMIAFKYDISIQNGNSIIDSKFNQLMRERESHFDIYKEIQKFAISA